MIRLLTAALTAAIGAALVACSAGSPATVHITDAAVKRAPHGAMFIRDLYRTADGDFWRKQNQGSLVGEAQIFCVGAANVKIVKSTWDGTSMAAAERFVQVADRDICPTTR